MLWYFVTCHGYMDLYGTVRAWYKQGDPWWSMFDKMMCHDVPCDQWLLYCKCHAATGHARRLSMIHTATALSCYTRELSCRLEYTWTSWVGSGTVKNNSPKTSLGWVLASDTNLFPREGGHQPDFVGPPSTELRTPRPPTRQHLVWRERLLRWPFDLECGRQLVTLSKA